MIALLAVNKVEVKAAAYGSAFTSGYDSGYLCLGLGGCSARGMADEGGMYTTGGSGTIYWYNGAVYNGRFLDVLEYVSVSGEGPAAIDKGSGFVQCRGYKPTWINRRLYFYEAGSNFTKQASMYGILQLTDFDTDEGWDISSSYNQWYVVSGANISKSGNSFRGTVDSDSNPMAKTVWIEFAAPAGNCLNFTYYSESWRYSAVNYDRNGMTLSVNYNPNGASDFQNGTKYTTFTQAVLSGVNTQVKANPWTGYLGHEFIGWNTASNGTGTSYTAGGTYRFSSNTTLYAQWRELSYNLTVNPNGGSWNGSTSPQTFVMKYGATKSISNPTRTGYKYTWALTGSGATFTNNTFKMGYSDASLKANWTANTYTVNIYGNLPSNCTSTLERINVPSGWTWNNDHYTVTLTYNDSTAIGNGISLNYSPSDLFKLKGYNIDSTKYYLNSNCTGTAYTKDTKNMTEVDKGTVNLYIKWTPIEYTIRFNGNNNWNIGQGTYTSTDLLGHKIKYDEPIKLENKFSRIAPYTVGNSTYKQSWYFIGWGTNPNSIIYAKSTVSPYTDCSVENNSQARVYNFCDTDDETYDLYAIWQRDIQLTFNLNNGKFKNSSDDIILKSTIYNNQMDYNFDINNKVTEAKSNYYEKQINTIDAYGTYNSNGENKLYTKVSSDGTYYRFLGWSLNPNATEPDSNFDVFNSSRKTTYNIKDNTVLYAVWEPVLQANIETNRTLGNLIFNDGTKPVVKLNKLNSSKGEQPMSVIIRPGEQGFYRIDSTGSNNLTFKIAFDTRITDIYTHGDPDSEWFDELNPSTHEDLTSGQGHGLNRQITGIKNFTRKFHIPQYLGTDRSYDTSNPDKTSVPVNKYVAQAVISQPSHYYNKVYGKDEQIIINVNIYISTNDSFNFDNDDDKLPSIISEIRTRIL